MRRVTLFIAMSLDGYIADRAGGIGWLGGEDPSENDMRTYDAFIRDIDTVVMGWNTYSQLTGELSPGEWPYAGMTVYVMTHRNQPRDANVEFVSADLCDFIRARRAEPGKGIWICGGAQIAQPLLRADLIDALHLNVMPVILGDGIRLFARSERALPLHLLKTESYNGITDLIYTRR